MFRNCIPNSMLALRSRLLPSLSHSKLPVSSLFAMADCSTAAGPAPDLGKTPLVDLMNEIGVEKDIAWETAWQKGVTPWDLNRPAPILSHLKTFFPSFHVDGRVLIPGCGSGHDAAWFTTSTSAREVLGLDFAQTAVDASIRLQKAKYADKTNLKFICADFFNFETGGKFDVIFDHAFFCALSPSMRQQWADRTADLLADNGLLVALMFPVQQVPHEGGPPFCVSAEMYRLHLEKSGLKEIVCQPAAPEMSLKPRAGREWIGIWQKK